MANLSSWINRKFAEKKRKANKKCFKRLDDTNLLAFSFDGRKDDILTRDKIDEKYHTRMIKESHLVILREPNSELIGYVRLEHETAEYKTTKLNYFFNHKKYITGCINWHMHWRWANKHWPTRWNYTTIRIAVKKTIALVRLPSTLQRTSVSAFVWSFG